FSSMGAPIVYVRQEKNHGFLGNCNAAAQHAHGRYVVMLNNDTITLPGWLDELIAPMEKDARIGLAGSKLLNADGTLQEAGGIFWNDGSAWNFGRNSDPRLPEFNYLKDIDYVSGASIALPTKLWNELGGFDPIYSPAYCEDSDIAFRVRDRGLRTVYAPHSTLVHHEGKSHGRDTSSGVKTYQIANQKKLLDRWRSVLEKEHFANGENVFLARDRSRNRPHILMVDHYVPQWDRDAGSRTVHHFLRMFVKAGFHVSFWPDNLNEDREYCEILQQAGVEVIYSAAYVDRFDEFMAANGSYFDYALVSRPHIALKYYDSIRAHSQCVILYYGHDIHHKRLESELLTSEDPRLPEEIREFRKLELENWRKADVVLYPSDEERVEVEKAVSDAVVSAVPMLGYFPTELSDVRANIAKFDARDFSQLLFVGGSHPPNVDALLWFSKEVMPLIVGESPQTKLNIVGSSRVPEIAALESEQIIIKGRISDEELATLYATAGVAIIPLRFGGGVKGKTIEALFHAIPLVATSIGMQGLHPQEPIAFIGDDRESYAKAVISAQTDHKLAKLHVERGVSFIDEHYSLDAMRRAFLPFIPQLGAEERPTVTAMAP
ncbi:MAG: glycosyltransferase, partial [Methylocystis sp.]